MGKEEKIQVVSISGRIELISKRTEQQKKRQWKGLSNVSLERAGAGLCGDSINEQCWEQERRRMKFSTNPAACCQCALVPGYMVEFNHCFSLAIRRFCKCELAEADLQRAGIFRFIRSFPLLFPCSSSRMAMSCPIDQWVGRPYDVFSDTWGLLLIMTSGHPGQAEMVPGKLLRWESGSRWKLWTEVPQLVRQRQKRDSNPGLLELP